MTRIPPGPAARPRTAPRGAHGARELGRTRPALYRSLAIVLVTVCSVPLGEAGPAGAVTALSRTIQGSATRTQASEWFNVSFDTGERFFGKFRGRIRFVTDTTATLSSTRTITSTDQGEVGAGQQVVTELRNDPAAARLQVTARPALQLIFEWQPRGDSYVCDNTTFPTFSGDDWFMRRDAGGSIGDGVCGAIDVTSDDFERIFRTTGIDLELPQVFNVLDQFFAAGFGGTQNLNQSHQLLQIKVCKIVAETFGLPLGDHCTVELNAAITAPLTTLSHTVEAQLCTEGQMNGTSVPCLQNVGPTRTLTYTSAVQSFSTPAPCPGTTANADVRVTNPVWHARLEDVTVVGPTLDLNVHLTANGDGVDVHTLPLRGQISLLNEPAPLDVTYPQSSVFALHVADVTPDDDPPSVVLSPSEVTIAEGSSTIFTPLATDLCTPTADLSSVWTIDGTTIVGPTLTLGYSDDLPTALHRGSLVVSDASGNAAPALPIAVTVRNVPPSVQLSGLPADPVPVGTQLRLAADVTDPGADVMTWQWSFGDGTGVSRAGSSVSERSDSRTHAYAASGEYTLQVSVHDGTDLRSVGGTVIAFDSLARMVGAGTFTADSSSIQVPVGGQLSAHSNVSYAQGAVRPSGTFVADFPIATGANGTARAHVMATSYEWLLDTASGSKVQGVASLNGLGGWSFQAEVARSGLRPDTSRMTVTLWRPGVTTLANPDYRFSGSRDTGNIV